MIVIRPLPACDLARIAEIDRSEHVTLGYVYRDGHLQAEKVDWQVPRWLDTGPEFSVEAKMRDWSPLLGRGGVLLGALEGERLAGFAILRYRLTPTMAQLAVLHVSRGYRRRGVGRHLVQEVIRLARADGARALYVSATPSESAVGFYLAQGFVPTNEPNPELFALEPEDIHMVKQL